MVLQSNQILMQNVQHNRRLKTIYPTSKSPKRYVVFNKKQSPAMAKEPTTNSVEITWKVGDEIIADPPYIHARTISIVPWSSRLEGRPQVMAMSY